MKKVLILIVSVSLLATSCVSKKKYTDLQTELGDKLATTEKALADSKVEETAQIKLSKRETEILIQLSKGLNYNDISENLIISPSTVRKHIENIYKKLQVHNKLEAVQKAKKNNLI